MRGIGLIVVLLGVVGVVMRVGGKSMRFYPGTNVSEAYWQWCGRLGVALIGIGALLVLTSTL